MSKLAIQSKSVAAAEHDWYATRSGLASNSPLNAHKEAYFISKGFGGKPVTQMEEEWLLSVAARNCEGEYEKWVGACQAQSVAVGRSINDCKFNFFTGVPAGTNP